MVMTVALPNGVIMNGVPDDASQLDIARHAISKGYAQSDDFREYPDIYSQLQPKKDTQPKIVDSGESFEQLRKQAVDNSQSTQSSGLSMAEGMAQASSGFGDSLGETTIDRWNRETPAERKEDIRMAASFAAMPLAFTGIGIPAAAAIDTAANVAGDVAGSAITGQDVKPIDLAVDVGSGVAPLPIAAAFKRLSPIAKAWVSHRIAPSSLASDAVRAEEAARGLVDEVPAERASTREEVLPEGEPKSNVDAAIARDAELDKKLNEAAIRNYASVLADSYMAKFLRPAKTATTGQSAQQALRTFRGFTDPYSFSALPHAGEIDPALSEFSHYEAQMRHDSPRMRAILERVESGEQGLEQELYDEIENYRAEQSTKAGQVVEEMPVAKMRNLQRAAEHHRKLFGLLDTEGATGGEWRPVSRAERMAAEAGLQEAIAPMAQRFGADAKRYNAALSQQWQEAHHAGAKNVATAIKMRMEAVSQMRDNIMSLAGIRNKYGEVPKFKPLTPDQLTTYIAASDTHDIAKAGDALLREYDVINDWHNALPVVRDGNVTDKITRKGVRTAARAAGAAAGGLPGMVVTELALGPIERMTARAVRKLRKNELAKEISKSINKEQ